jgi:hypothetical protein
MNEFIYHFYTQVITTPQIISTIHKSPQQPLRIFSLLSSPAVSWQRLILVEILQLPRSLHSRLASVSQMNVSAKLCTAYNISAPTT